MSIKMQPTLLIYCIFRFHKRGQGDRQEQTRQSWHTYEEQLTQTQSHCNVVSYTY